MESAHRKKIWLLVPPWVILGAVAILVPLFAFFTWENVSRHKDMSTRLLLEKGEAIIRSFEAGARAGEGMRWGSFELQKLLIETAQQPGVEYFTITDTEGRILADSDPGVIGEVYETGLDLTALSREGRAQWRVIEGAGGPDTFEVFRRFAPREEPFEGFSGRRQGAAYVIFVGLDRTPVQEAHAQDTRNTIITASVLLLISVAGIVSLFLALGYRSVRASLSRVKALSDSLVAHMPVGLVAVDTDGRVAVFNDTAEKLFGRRSAEAIGRPAAEILPVPCLEILRDLGRERPIIEREFECTIREAHKMPLGVIAAVLKDDDGALIGRIGLFRDLSELQRLRLEVERSRRLAAVGSLAAGVAHEIRNPLSSIKGFATYFRQRYGGVPDDVKMADIMIREVDRLNRVITELLEFSRPVDLKRKATDAAGLVQRAADTIEIQAREKGIALRMELAAGMPPVFVDPDRMMQVLLNLFLNALAAMERGGVLSVGLDLQNGRTLRISVADTGTGIPREDLGRVFDPYFTTKPSGTGLGLAIVHRIVEAHGGDIRLESEPGRGTTFTILLPLADPGKENP
ncbi:MAG: PAS domain-containing protein [Syntrophobacterales bacterium]|nr:PAS domain-containing protein [Syntrophobacterales bacterium]HNQ00949.1 ATP-binding protein [Syntrophales bacterium]HNS53717.1 ATP-binding protein [Syntrophales bacterium]